MKPWIMTMKNTIMAKVTAAFVLVIASTPTLAGLGQTPEAGQRPTNDAPELASIALLGTGIAAIESTLKETPSR